MNEAVPGLLLVLFAGALGSATLLPMKFVRNWPWEQTWLVYALSAYLILPLATAWLTVPRLPSVYAGVEGGTLVRVALFGWGWGLSVVLFGLAVARAGLAVSNAVILGCSISLGSLVPMAMHGVGADQAGSVLRIVGANGLLLSGVLLCALAGYGRDRRRTSDDAQRTVRGGGLLLCFVAGVLTPLINIALAAGAPITQQARANGAAASQAANALWGLAVSAGSVPSIVYCLALLSRNRSWQGRAVGRGNVNLALCLLMGGIFMASTIGYGAGALRMGDWGPVVGWPVYVSSLLIGNNIWGGLTGEWRGTVPRVIRLMMAGIGLQIAGIIWLFLVAPG